MIKRADIQEPKYGDIKAEAYMVEADYTGLLDDKKLLYVNGGFKRNFRNDIEKTHPADQNSFKIERDIVELNRNGIYDGFPELLFHKSKKSKQFKSIKDIREDHIYNNEIEENTRRFFWPLDHYLVKMKCHIYAHETGKNSVDRISASKSLQRFWGIPPIFEKWQVAMLCKVMPYAKEISMNVAWIQQTFNMILGINVSIKKVLKSVEYPIKNGGRIMGNSFLGNNTTIGSNLRITKYQINIELGPIGKSTANSFSLGEKSNKALDFIIETFVPLDFTVEKTIILEADTAISFEKDPNQRSILGLTSTL
ncbi:hypothetical protein G3O08_08680 [Cryomorpha ignava]|uniref:Type VI secretion system baseplate subunit TssG n=1 Tax=Cryomorpha ignava TaxID=101383 RepID=A0A7K3WQ08_9FLAO|nr:type VI secretion system baseplate subunit TssG [Cryomorpha ignava]NEN23574.1 hypothetical protein [Cryomorpha ignava]